MYVCVCIVVLLLNVYENYYYSLFLWLLVGCLFVCSFADVVMWIYLLCRSLQAIQLLYERLLVGNEALANL